jgi:hypothetical protein
MRIIARKRDEVTECWRKLHNEKLHNLYSSPSIIRMVNSMRMLWAGNGARIGPKRKAYRILAGNPERKRPLRRLRRKWVDNIEMDRREIRWCGMDWIDLAEVSDQWKALVNTLMNLRSSIKCWVVLE